MVQWKLTSREYHRSMNGSAELSFVLNRPSLPATKMPLGPNMNANYANTRAELCNRTLRSDKSFPQIQEQMRPHGTVQKHTMTIMVK